MSAFVIKVGELMAEVTIVSDVHKAEDARVSLLMPSRRPWLRALFPALRERRVMTLREVFALEEICKKIRNSVIDLP